MGRVKIHWILVTLILTSAMAGCMVHPREHAEITEDDLDGDGYSNEYEKICRSDETHGPNSFATQLYRYHHKEVVKY